MKKLEIILEKDRFYPGDEVSGTVVLRSDKTIRSRGLWFQALGREESMVYVSRGKNSHYTTDHHIVVEFKESLAEAGDIQPGEYNFPFSFIIPEEAIPSYAGKDASVVYALATWVDIPHWPDARAKMPFFVTAQSIAYPVIPGGLQYSSEEGETETAGERPVIELRMERKGFYPGEKIPCTVRITNQAKKKLRKLTASLLAVEHTRALSYTGVAIPETHKTEIDLPKEQDILEFPIYLPIPKGVRSSYEGKLTRLEWQLNLKLDVALGKDVSLKCPIAIHGPQKVDKDRFAELTKTLKFMM